MTRRHRTRLLRRHFWLYSHTSHGYRSALASSSEFFQNHFFEGHQNPLLHRFTTQQCSSESWWHIVTVATEKGWCKSFGMPEIIETLGLEFHAFSCRVDYPNDCNLLILSVQSSSAVFHVILRCFKVTIVAFMLLVEWHSDVSGAASNESIQY